MQIAAIRGNTQHVKAQVYASNDKVISYIY